MQTTSVPRTELYPVEEELFSLVHTHVIVLLQGILNNPP